MPIFLNGLPCVNPGMPESSTNVSTGRSRLSATSFGSPFRSSRPRVELGVDDDGVGVRAVGDERLLAVEDVVVAVTPDVGLHPAERVRAGVGLRDRPCRNLFHRHQRRQPALLLRQRAARHDRRGAEPEADAHRGDGAQADAGEFADHDRRHRRLLADAAESRAVAFRRRCAFLLARPLAVQHVLDRLGGQHVEPELAEQLPDDRVRRHLAALQRVDVRSHFLVDEPPHRVADQQVGLGPLDHQCFSFVVSWATGRRCRRSATGRRSRWSRRHASRPTAKSPRPERHTPAR